MTAMYKTPGVYVEEIVKFPPSVAPVETAIPAFIGYTEKAMRNGESLINKPICIESIAEYEEIFGGVPSQDVIVYLDNNNNFVRADANVKLYLYDSLRMFYANGGGKCYIISVGKYPATDAAINKEDFEKGLSALEQEDEPTIIILPDAVSIPNGPCSIQQLALAQCNKLMDRIVLCDIVKQTDLNHLKEEIKKFRSGIGINFLKYGAAYAPWININIPRQIWHKNLKLKTDGSNDGIKLESLTTDVLILNLICDTKFAETVAASLKEVEIRLSGAADKTLTDALQTALDKYRDVKDTSTSNELAAVLQTFTKPIFAILELVQKINKPIPPYPDKTNFEISKHIESYLLSNPRLKESILELVLHHKLQCADLNTAKSANTVRDAIKTAADAVPLFAAAAEAVVKSANEAKKAAEAVLKSANEAKKAFKASPVNIKLAADKAVEAETNAAAAVIIVAVNDAKNVTAVFKEAETIATATNNAVVAANNAVAAAKTAAEVAKTAAEKNEADAADKVKKAADKAAETAAAADKAALAADKAMQAANTIVAAIPAADTLSAAVKTAVAYVDAVASAAAINLPIIQIGASLDATAQLFDFSDETALLESPVTVALLPIVAAQYLAADTIRKRADVACDAAYSAAQNAIALFNSIQAGTYEFEKNLNDSLLAAFGKFKELVTKGAEALNLLPPSGAIAGIYATVDRERGVWKAPANVSLNAVISPAVKISHEQQAEYNVDVNSGKSINIIRSFTGKGTLVWGARTLAGNDNEWRYINVRRFFNFAEESIKKATEQFVFEPNDANTWVRVQAMIENFLTTLWRQGALQGVKPEHAFYVAIGLGKTMTALDILEGRMIIEIGMAVVRPAEFIILKFSHKMAES